MRDPGDEKQNEHGLILKSHPAPPPPWQKQCLFLLYICYGLYVFSLPQHPHIFIYLILCPCRMAPIFDMLIDMAERISGKQDGSTLE